jgi:hypothetical protein
MSTNQPTRKEQLKMKVNTIYGQMAALGFCKLSDEEVKSIEQEFKESMEELSKLRTI